MTATTRPLVYTPAAGELGYTFGGRPPVATLACGQVLRVATEDCFGGLVRGGDDLPSRVCTLPYVNPVSGPFFIEGAEPGDTLAVHIASIVPARDWAVSATFPHFGALTSSHETATLQPPLQERVWRYTVDTAAGVVRYHATRSQHTVELPLDPMLGTIGVAPDGGRAISTITSGAHGGNLDTPQIRAGATVYLPVFVHGAMLAVGDGHARQGDGEACGVAVECATTSTLVVDLIKNATIGWPRIETDTHLMSVGAGRPLEDAYRIAHTDLTGWIAALTGLDLLDAYQLLSQAGTARIGNVCDPAYTVVARISKRHLPHPAAAYSGPADPEGAHARLRGIGRESAAG
jgi:acetamidase/formamidase